MRENHFLCPFGSHLNTSKANPRELRPHCSCRAKRTFFQCEVPGKGDLLPQRKVGYACEEVGDGPWGIVGRGSPLHPYLSPRSGILNQLREYQRFRGFFLSLPIGDSLRDTCLGHHLITHYQGEERRQREGRTKLSGMDTATQKPSLAQGKWNVRLRLKDFNLSLPEGEYVGSRVCRPWQQSPGECVGPKYELKLV